MRNAFNNGFLCIESPELVKRLRERFSSGIKAGKKTVAPGDEISIDFTSSEIIYRDEKFHFPTLGSVPQSLVIAGGVESLVARKLNIGKTVLV